MEVRSKSIGEQDEAAFQVIRSNKARVRPDESKTKLQYGGGGFRGQETRCGTNWN